MSDKGFTPKLTIRSGSIQGYGGPGYDWTRGVYHSRLLFDVHASYDSATVLLERQKWERAWPSEGDFRAAIANKVLASPVCSNCALPTEGEGSTGPVSCLDRHWCKRPACVSVMEATRVAYREGAERQRQEWNARQESDKQERIRQLDEATKCFHWRDGWYFRRNPDGSVRVMLREGPQSEWLRVDVTVPANEWASIVCSVSVGGETGERWEQAKRFHGETP